MNIGEEVERHSAVIVGAGPTGCVAALLLASHGVASVVIDRQPEMHPHPRAVHLDDEVCRILGRIGVAEEFARISRPGRGLRLIDRDSRVLTEFSRSDLNGKHGYPQSNMFDQPELESLLRARMIAEPKISFQGGSELVDIVPPASMTGSWMLTVRDSHTRRLRTIEADHLLGCDGANSTVRRAMGATMVELGFQQRWLVVDIDVEADLEQWDGVHQVCDRHRAITYMRVGATRYRWEVRLQEGESKDSFRTMESLLPLIEPWLTGRALEGAELLRVAEYTFRAQVASNWRSGSAFLLGDAAHLTPPFIGQGLGAGLRDAQNLAWKLAATIRGELPPEALDSYEVERKAHARTTIRNAVVLGSAMTGGGVLGEVLRKLIFPRAQLIPGFRRLMVGSASPRLTASSLLFGRSMAVRSPGSLVGTLVPNSARVEGGRLDDLCNGFLLLTLTLPDSSTQSMLDRMGVTTVVVAENDGLADWLGHHRARVALVRPDQTVMAAGHDIAKVMSFMPLGRRADRAELPSIPRRMSKR